MCSSSPQGARGRPEDRRQEVRRPDHRQGHPVRPSRAGALAKDLINNDKVDLMLDDLDARRRSIRSPTPARPRACRASVDGDAVGGVVSSAAAPSRASRRRSSGPTTSLRRRGVPPDLRLAVERRRSRPTRRSGSCGPTTPTATPSARPSRRCSRRPATPIVDPGAYETARPTTRRRSPCSRRRTARSSTRSRSRPTSRRSGSRRPSRATPAVQDRAGGQDRAVPVPDRGARRARLQPRQRRLLAPDVPVQVVAHRRRARSSSPTATRRPRASSGTSSSAPRCRCSTPASRRSRPRRTRRTRRPSPRRCARSRRTPLSSARGKIDFTSGPVPNVSPTRSSAPSGSGHERRQVQARLRDHRATPPTRTSRSARSSTRTRLIGQLGGPQCRRHADPRRRRHPQALRRARRPRRRRLRAAEPTRPSGIVGPNGAGKTTLLNVLAGGARAHRGHGPVPRRGRHDGVTRPGAAASGIARAHQIPQPFGGMTVFENVFVAAAHGGGRCAATRPTRHAIDSLELCGMLASPTGGPRRSACSTASGSSWRARWHGSRTVLLLDEIGGGLTDAEAERAGRDHPRAAPPGHRHRLDRAHRPRAGAGRRTPGVHGRRAASSPTASPKQCMADAGRDRRLSREAATSDAARRRAARRPSRPAHGRARA